MRFTLSTLWLCLIFTPGCGDKGRESIVQGTVTIDGELAPRGIVTFHPKKGGASAYGTIHDNGSYSLRVGQGNMRNEDAAKIFAGDYTVTVVVTLPPTKDGKTGEGGPPTPGPRITALKYANKDTSDLVVKVKPGLNVVPLDVPHSTPEEVEAVEESESVEAHGKETAAKESEQPADSTLEDQSSKDKSSEPHAAEEAPTTEPTAPESSLLPGSNPQGTATPDSESGSTQEKAKP